MRFLRYLMLWSNPTRAWKEDVCLALIVDLDQNRLAGVRLGDPVEKLSILGPAKITSSGYAWPHKGIDATASDSRIWELGFYFGHAAEPRKGEFVGGFRFGGEPVRLSKACNESNIQALFGQPFWRDQDEDEILLFYETSVEEWQLELVPGGTLKHLRVGFPLLADPEQRLAYGVTSPMPPTFPPRPAPGERHQVHPTSSGSDSSPRSTSPGRQ